MLNLTLVLSNIFLNVTLYHIGVRNDNWTVSAHATCHTVNKTIKHPNHTFLFVHNSLFIIIK